MWPFQNRTTWLLDTVDSIQLDDNREISLISEHPESEKDYRTLIEEKMSEWMMRELTVAQADGIPLENVFVYQLMHLDLKHIPFSGNASQLSACLMDNNNSNVGSRFLDLMVTISMSLPTWYVELLKGRMLYSVLYVIPKTYTYEGEEAPFPSKHQWVEALDKWPFLPFLFIMQDVYDTDTGIRKLEELLQDIGEGNIVQDGATPIV